MGGNRQAQPSPTPAAPEAENAITYEGQRVASVELAGRPDLNLRAMKPLVAQPINAPYTQQKIDQTVAALKKSGQFQDVDVQVTPEANGLRVLFILRPAYYFGMFQFPDISHFSYSRLLQAANSPRQEPYSAGRVEEAESNLLEFLHQSGYFMATVEPELQTDSKLEIVNVLFHINLKRHAKFGDVIIQGTPAAEAQKLKSSLRSIRARIHGAYLKPGRSYSHRRVQSATQFLQSQLGKQHHLAARVNLLSTVYNPRSNRADLTFQIREGPLINVKIEGAHIWGRTEKKLIPIFQENTVDRDLVHEGEQNLTSYFQSKGFFDVKVASQIERHGDDRTILYQIAKG
ncbi:MAG: POTRA domain-containing protein, partial [Candidatus Angelobacter sp.]